MGETSESLRGIVNGSGYLLQLRVAHEIKNVLGPTWIVEKQEFRWTDEEIGKMGYIDIVASTTNRSTRMIIECKKSKDATWTFLLPDSASEKQTKAELLWFSRSKDESSDTHLAVGYHEFQCDPISFASPYCVLRGSSEKDKPMLERICDDLLLSTEVYMTNLALKNSPLGMSIFLPVIVTNAELKVCQFDVDQVNLGTGEVDDCVFETVPFVRFHKPLYSNMEALKRPTKLRLHGHEGQERTVFVVNSLYLQDFIQTYKQIDVEEDEAEYNYWQNVLS